MRPLKIIALPVLLIAMTTLAYLPIWNNDFIDDDDEYMITTNPYVLNGLTRTGVEWAWWYQAPYWMPITWLSFQFDAGFPPTSQFPTQPNLNPLVFHGESLFWHTCNALLLFALFNRLTGKVGRSFLVAALFAIHPMHVESVAWAIERKDVLMCFFGLLTLLAYVWYVEKRSWMAYVGMLLAYQASLMCKPMLLTLPFVLLLLDYWPLCRFRFRSAQSKQVFESEKQQVPLGRLFLEKLPVFFVAVLMAGQTMATRPGNPMPDLGLIGRSMNAFSGYACYLSKSFYPDRLAFFYPHPRQNWSLPLSLVGMSLVFGCTAIAIWQANRRRWLPVGWLWFVGTIVPVIGLTQGGLQAWANRFSYWPHIGLFIVIVWGASELANWLRIPSLIRGGVWAGVLAILMALTWIQVTYWKSGITLWEHTLTVTEDNDHAHEHLSFLYRREGRLADADFHAEEAYRIQLKRRLRHSDR